MLTKLIRQESQFQTERLLKNLIKVSLIKDS